MKFSFGIWWTTRINFRKIFFPQGTLQSSVVCPGPNSWEFKPLLLFLSLRVGSWYSIQQNDKLIGEKIHVFVISYMKLLLQRVTEKRCQTLPHTDLIEIVLHQGCSTRASKDLASTETTLVGIFRSSNKERWKWNR